VSRTFLSSPAASQIHVARRHDRSCDSSGWPNALSCARARVATNSPRRSGEVKIGNSPDVLARTVGAPFIPHVHPSTDRGQGEHADNQFLRGESAMAESTTSAGRSIKVGVIADQTGPLSFVGIANA